MPADYDSHLCRLLYEAAEVDEDLLGVSQSDMDKVTITITCNSKLDHFAAAAAERFPNIRLVQDCYTGQYRISEHVADIEHHDFETYSW